MKTDSELTKVIAMWYLQISQACFACCLSWTTIIWFWCNSYVSKKMWQQALTSKRSFLTKNITSGSATDWYEFAVSESSSQPRFFYLRALGLLLCLVGTITPVYFEKFKIISVSDTYISPLFYWKDLQKFGLYSQSKYIHG